LTGAGPAHGLGTPNAPVPYDRPIVGAIPALAERPDAEDAPPAPRRPRRDLLTPAAIALTLTPLVVTAVHMLRSDVVLIGDLATTELLTRDVGVHTPSIGPYSRDGWHHPGPALFYALALPYRLLGRDGAALAVGVLLINAVSIGAMGALARRRGGTGLMLATLVGCGLLLQALGPTFLATPWNVYVTVLPYGALLFLVWAVVRDERWALPWATVVTSFLVQTHVGYVALAVPLWLGAVAWTVGAAVAERRWAGRGREAVGDESVGDEGGGEGGDEAAGDEAAGPADPAAPPRRGGRLAPAVVAALIAVVMWLPPVVEQVTHAEGNMDQIIEWFGDPGEDARTLLEGWRVVADQYSVQPEWIVGQGTLSVVAEPAAVYEGVVPVLLVPVAAAIAALWRRRGWAARALAATWLAASVLGVVATARTVGPLYAYRLHWAWVIGMLGGVFVLWCGWALATDRAPVAGRRAATGLALAALAVLAAVTSVRASEAEVPVEEASVLTAGLGAPAEAAVRDLPGDGPVLVRMGTFGAIGPGLGLVAELERRGVDVVVDNEGAGEHRLLDRDEHAVAVLHVAIDEDILQAASAEGFELVALVGDATMASLQENADRVAELARQASSGAITPQEQLDRTAALLLPTYSAAAVFLEHPAPDADG
jgi:hypothetical protein